MAASLSGQIGLMLSGIYDAGVAWGNDKNPFPSVPPVPFSYGTGVGQFTKFAFPSGTATAAASSIDLTTVVGPGGVVQNFAKVNFLAILNDSTVDANILLFDGTATNSIGTPFNSIATAKILVPPGFASGGINYPGWYASGGLNLSGFTVDATHKIISLNPGAATIPWRAIVLGR